MLQKVDFDSYLPIFACVSFITNTTGAFVHCQGTLSVFMHDWRGSSFKMSIKVYLQIMILPFHFMSITKKGFEIKIGLKHGAHA